MKRRDWLKAGGAIGVLGVLPRAAARAFPAEAPAAPSLAPPARGPIPVAFLLSEGAVVIDFCGPWEVFQDVGVPNREGDAFQLYTVAETKAPIQTSGGMTVVPEHSFATAPQPKVLVIPAQQGHSEATLQWIRSVAKTADLVMSVCTGAFLLARTGLLAGKSATTHHQGYRGLAVQFPDVHVKPGARFVEEGNLATAGGLSSGIDLALRVVERYFGREVARDTAFQMEYQGEGWLNPDSNAPYVVQRTASKGQALCPICDMEVDPKTSPSTTHKGKTYYFCSQDHKQTFEQAPEKFAEAVAR
jgi:transcriptional regulator GlxA family with amidase domain/YHS domain-containing protein